MREEPLVSLDHAPAGIAAAGFRAVGRRRQARTWTEGGHGPEPKPSLRPGRDLVDAPHDLVAIERLEVLGHPVRDALPLNRHDDGPLTQPPAFYRWPRCVSGHHLCVGPRS